MKDCNCKHYCAGECPEYMECPLDDNHIILKKDRSKSRQRHHGMLRERAKSKKIYTILCSKTNKVSNATVDEVVSKAIKREVAAYKKAKRYKKIDL